MTIAYSAVCSDGKDSTSPRKEEQPYSHFILCMYTSEPLERSFSWESSLLLMIVFSFIYLSLYFEMTDNLTVSLWRVGFLGFFFLNEIV